MRVVWLKSAVTDLLHVREHALDDLATTWLRLETLVNSLTRFSATWRPGPGGRDARADSPPPRRYLVVYRLKDDTVQVLRILHSRQKWSP